MPSCRLLRPHKLRVAQAVPPFPRTDIRCTRKTGFGAVAQFADRFRHGLAWSFHPMDARHSPNVTAPAALADPLLSVA